MTFENLQAGINIFAEHGAKGYCIAAEHDVFYAASAREVPMKLSTIRKLYKLGWFIETDTESWAAYT